MSFGKRRRTDGLHLYNLKNWKALRRRVLKEANYQCINAGKVSGCDIVANEVDHIKPHLGDRRLFYDRRNLQPMCGRCHSRKTHGEVFGKPRGADEDGNPLDPDHHWNQEEID